MRHIHTWLVRRTHTWLVCHQPCVAHEYAGCRQAVDYKKQRQERVDAQGAAIKDKEAPVPGLELPYDDPADAGKEVGSCSDAARGWRQLARAAHASRLCPAPLA